MRRVFLVIFAAGDAVVAWYLFSNYHYAIGWLFSVLCVGIASWLFHGELVEAQQAEQMKGKRK